MKILTKKWIEKREQVRIALWLKEFDSAKMGYEDVKIKSWEDFCTHVAHDFELAKVCLKTNITDKLYEAKVDRDRKALLSLPQDVFNKVKDIDSAFLGYACIEDKQFLTSYADEILKDVEEASEKANELTKIAEDYLPEEFTLDDIVDELIYEEYSNGKDYFINFGGLTVCIENYQIIERENFKINEWVENNPLTLWTALDSAELHYVSDNCYELHLLLVNGDEYENEEFWYLTIRGTNVKYATVIEPEDNE